MIFIDSQYGLEIMPLANLSVLLTRPEGQVQALADMVTALGCTAVLFPTIIVRALSDNQQAVMRIMNLTTYNFVIFISTNAVEYFARICDPLQQPWPAMVEVVAVGEATAGALKAHQYPVNIVPSGTFSSEALLAHPRLLQLQGKKIAIVRGRGGRELLAQGLRERGAIVEYIEVYSRECPDSVNPATLTHWCRSSRIAVLTSAEGMENLLTLAGSALRDCTLSTPLVLVSERLRQHALSLGFCSKLIVTNNASDRSIIAALHQYRNDH